MSAVIHFVVYAEDGVIKSDVLRAPMPTLPPDLKNAPLGVKAPDVPVAALHQRFACGVEPSQLWGKKCPKTNILHVASGEFIRVTCEACKASQEYKDAAGIVDQPTANASPAPQQRTVNDAGTPATLASPNAVINPAPNAGSKPVLPASNPTQQPVQPIASNV